MQISEQVLHSSIFLDHIFLGRWNVPYIYVQYDSKTLQTPSNRAQIVEDASNRPCFLLIYIHFSHVQADVIYMMNGFIWDIHFPRFSPILQSDKIMSSTSSIFTKQDTETGLPYLSSASMNLAIQFFVSAWTIPCKLYRIF